MSVLAVLSKMDALKVSAVPVVDSSGTLIANFSASDLKCLGMFLQLQSIL